MVTKQLLLFLFLLLVSTFNLQAQVKSFSLDELAGTYLTGHTFGGSKLQLTANSEYKHLGYTEFDEYIESGKYFLDSNVLTFKVFKSSRKSISGEKEINLLDPKENKDAAKEPRIYVYLPIRWRTRMYLIPKHEMMEFINAVNLSVEPRDNATSKIYLGKFYLQDKTAKDLDFDYPIFLVRGLPELPGEWNSFLLKNSVTANIIEITNQGKEKIAIIDKGSNDGLKIGMRLIAGNREPSLWSGAEILSVEEKTAKVKVLKELKVGDKLNSKYIHENPIPYLN